MVSSNGIQMQSLAPLAYSVNTYRAPAMCWALLLMTMLCSPPLWQGKQASVSPTLGGNAGAQGITGLVAIGKEQPPR